MYIRKGGNIMKHTKYAALLLAEMVAITALTGCTGLTGGQPEKHTRDIYAMNTFMSLTAYGDNARDALDETAERITSLEKELSVTLPDSDISRLNASGSAKLGADALAIIAAADKPTCFGKVGKVVLRQVLHLNDATRPSACSVGAVELEHTPCTAIGADRSLHCLILFYRGLGKLLPESQYRL